MRQKSVWYEYVCSICVPGEYGLYASYVSIRMSYAQMTESSHAYGHVIAHTHAHTHTHTNTPHQSRGWQSKALQHIAWMPHVTHMNESCQKYEWVMSHIWINQVNRMMRSATCMNASCHTHRESRTSASLIHPIGHIPHSTLSNIYMNEERNKERTSHQLRHL